MKPLLPSRSRDAGFSMVELLAVLVILAVLVALVAPSMSGMLARDRADSAMARMAGDIMQARMEAVRSGRTVELVLDNGSYTIVRGALGNQPAVTVKRVNLASEFPGMTIRPTLATLRFDSRGLVAAGSETSFEAAQGSHPTRRLTVTAVGNIYRDY